MFLFICVSDMHAKYALALILVLQGKETYQCLTNRHDLQRLDFFF